MSLRGANPFEKACLDTKIGTFGQIEGIWKNVLATPLLWKLQVETIVSFNSILTRKLDMPQSFREFEREFDGCKLQRTYCCHQDRLTLADRLYET